jgi:dihydroorotase
MKTKITNIKTLGHFLDSNNELEEAEILIQHDKILKLEKQIKEESSHIIDGKGALLVPGLIDPQVHFREPGQEHKEDIESGSKAAAKGGFTTVICMPNTNPTSDDPKVLEYIINRSKEVNKTRIFPTGAVTVGLKGKSLTNFESLKKAGAIALTDDGKGIQDDSVMLEAFQKAKEMELSILDHSEDESLSQGGAIHEGEVSKKHGVKGIKSESESVHVKRGCDYSLKTGAHYHVLHISTKESLQYVQEAKSRGANVTCEVSPHHLLLCDEDIPLKENGELDANFKMNPPLRSREDMMACREALKSGLIDAIATDHAPHSSDEKNQPIENAPFGIIGLETAFTLLYTHFVRTGEITLKHLVDLMTVNAAGLFKLPYGRLEAGATADIALIDLERSEIIKEDFFHSKSKNSPFYHKEVFGLPVMTIFEGRIVYNNL